LPGLAHLLEELAWHVCAGVDCAPAPAPLSLKSGSSSSPPQPTSETSTYPRGTLALTSPIALGALPAAGVIRTYHATADLTLHGHTRKVTFPLTAERRAADIEVSGSIPILFADWGIGNPSFAGFVTTQNHGLLEFLIKFSRS
jgi:hypothetical protein